MTTQRDGKKEHARKADPIYIFIGGRQPWPFTPSVAGPRGCDPCMRCDRRPPHRARIWTNCYADIICDACATKAAVPETARQPT